MRGRAGVDDGFAAALTAARGGDPRAWSVLYDEIAPLVLGYLRAQRSDDPEDVTAEVLLAVVRDLPRFDGDRRAFRSWALVIAHHRMLDARRRATRRPRTVGATGTLEHRPGTEDLEADCLAALGYAELEPALADLTVDQRTVLLLRAVADLSVAEVARLLGKRQGAVKQLHHRAVMAMRRALVAPDPDPDVVIVLDAPAGVGSA